jgi:hypothetical protein
MTMPLEFRGLAIMDPPGKAIRFAGYPKGRRDGSIAICEVSIYVLRALAANPGASPAELMDAFERYKEAIFEVASRKFDEGETRPRVSAVDLSPPNN